MQSRKDIAQTHDMLQRLQNLGIDREDAWALRRISMTLHRWHELECGTDAGCIERGRKQPQWAIQHIHNGCWWDGEFWTTEAKRKTFDGKPSIPGAGKPDHVLEFAKAVRIGSEFISDENGKPFMGHENGNGPRLYFSTPDRERGAQKRLAKIMARYPGLTAYVQGDPRGAALYILKPGDIPEGASIDSCYSRGVAVFK